MAMLELPSVTLCAAASVNQAATVAALRASMTGITFAECLYFSHDERESDPNIRFVQCPKINSSAEYSEFVLLRLPEYVRTSHCLIVQWDGFVLNPDRWNPEFLQYDYIGAPWPQFHDGFDVGNGGFSLRSRRLLNACLDHRFKMGGPEDVAICRTNRTLLETEHKILFADWPTAEQFSFERTVPPRPTFGFHGVFNMIDEIGADRFWEIYQGLDDPATALVDYPQIYRQLGSGGQSYRRRLRFTFDRIASLFRR